MKSAPLGFLTKSRLSPVPCTSLLSPPWQPRHLLFWSWLGFGTSPRSSENTSLTVVINMPWVTASPWNHLMILAQCEHMRWKTHFHHHFFSQVRREGELTWWDTLTRRCVCSPSALGERRPDGRHAQGERKAAPSAQTDGTNQVSYWGMHPLFLPVSLFSFPFSHSSLLLLSGVLHFHCLTFLSFHVTFSSLHICQFQFGFSLFLRLLFFASASLYLSLSLSLSFFLYALFLTCCPKPHQHSASHYSH